MGKSTPRLIEKPGRDLFLTGAGAADLVAAVLEKDTPCRFHAHGTSMHPFIKHGDAITIGAKGRAARLGDVVAVRNPATGKLLVHRVMARRPDAVLLKGDNCVGSDGWVPHGNVLGRVVACERGGRRARFGLGPERVLIAWMGRYFRVSTLARLTRPFRRLPRADDPEG